MVFITISRETIWIFQACDIQTRPRYHDCVELGTGGLQNSSPGFEACVLLRNRACYLVIY